MRGGDNLPAFLSLLMKKIRSLYFKYILENTSSTWEAFASECARRNLDPETIAESFQ